MFGHEFGELYRAPLNILHCTEKYPSQRIEVVGYHLHSKELILHWLCCWIVANELATVESIVTKMVLLTSVTSWMKQLFYLIYFIIYLNIKMLK